MKEIAIRVHSRAGSPSRPILRIGKKSGVLGMGSSSNWDDQSQTVLTHVEAIACSPEMRSMNLKVGVAEGDWHTALQVNPPSVHSSVKNGQTSGPDGIWEAGVEMIEGANGDVALAFHYSVREDYETRMVYVKTGGAVVTLQGKASHGAGSLRNSIVSISAADFAQLTEFQLQKRRYEWVEFRNVSLQLGSRTSIESVDAPGLETNPAQPKSPALF